MTQAYIHGLAGGGSAGTNWNRYTLDQIWDMVRTEDGRVTYAQIHAWERMARLCNEQADQLDRATGQLLKRWPPRPGSAAETFSAHVLTLVRSMRKAAAAATANQEPMSNITAALTTARIEIAELLETRRRYALAEKQLTPQPMQHPGEIPPAEVPPNLQRPPEDWRNQLAQQARAIMSRTDDNVGGEAARIRQLDPYGLHPSSDKVDIFDPGENPGGRTSAEGSASPHGFERAGVTDLLAGAGLPTLSIGSGLVSSHASESVDPILSGVGPQTTDTSVGTAGTSGPHMGALTPGTSVTMPVGVAIGPGGLIGPRMPSPTPRASARMDAATNGAGNRAGAGAGSGSRAGGQAMMPMAPMVPPRSAATGTSGLATAGRLGRGGRHTHPAGADADDPWAVAEGGPAVLEPADEPIDHDPGPGVIGLTR